MEKKEFDWFDKQKNIRTLWVLLFLLCGLSIAAQLLIPDAPVHFAVERYFGFFAVLGFVSCAVLILVAKVLGFFLKKDVTYYDR